jgi:hypothetical protein
MNNQPSLAREHHDVAGLGFRCGVALDIQQVARPDGGQHARAESAQAQLTTRAERLRR